MAQCMMATTASGTRQPMNESSPAFSADVRHALKRLATTSDRTSPTVFVGRQAEFDLLDEAVQGTARGETGHTVVVQGVPGAGKTSLLREYAARSMAAIDGPKPVIPVCLQADHLDASPAAIVKEIDRYFHKFEASDVWQRRKNKLIAGAAVLGKSLFAMATKKNFDEFREGAKSPESLGVALDDYVEFRFDRRDSIVVLLVDEAQSMGNASRVGRHIRMLHSGATGHTQVLLACFGLGDTESRLREQGLSRLASDHVRSIGVLSEDEAKHTVTKTLQTVLAGHPFDSESFDEHQRNKWIDVAASAILAESGNFPHHLANGCRAFAQIALADGISAEPPVEKLQSKCRGYRHEYYAARLRPWKGHTVALSHAFNTNRNGWTNIGDVRQVLAASANNGEPVDGRAASRLVDEMCTHGFVEERDGTCRLTLPSLASHFAEIRRGLRPDNDAVQAVRTAVAKLQDRGVGPRTP